MVKLIIRKIYVQYLKFIQHKWEGYKFSKKINIPNHFNNSIKKSYILGIVSIIRGEDEYLKEWIDFHSMLGVEHFVIYDNGSSSETKILLKDYIDKQIVTLIPFPDIVGLRDGSYANTLSIQQLAYGDFILRFRKHFKYILQLDIDEFLFPKEKNTITEILNSYIGSDLERIMINWTNFGNNGHINKPKGLVIENYTKCAKNIEKEYIKSISNTDYLSTFFAFTNVHKFSHRFSITKLLSKLIFNCPITLKDNAANRIFQLNHYITKSKEEYLRKAQINKGGYMTGKETEESFLMLNKIINEVTDKNILRFLPNLKLE